MLHLEALESRCLLSNNSGLLVLAEMAQAPEPAQLAAPGDHLNITDSIGVGDDLSMDYGTHTVGYLTTPESITFMNNTGQSQNVIVLFKDLEHFSFTATDVYPEDSGIDESDILAGEFTISLEPNEVGTIDIAFNPKFGPDNFNEVIKFKTEAADPADNQIQTVDLIGNSTLLTSDQLYLNTAEISNTISISGTDQQFVYAGDPLNVDLSTVNTIGAPVENALLDLNFYLSSDNVLDIQDSLLRTEIVDLVPVGTSTSSYSVSLPANSQGTYTLFASYDVDHNVVSVLDYANTQVWSSEEIFVVTDSIFVNDTESIVDDMDIDYGEVPVGSNSDLHYVNLVNTSGTDVSVDSDLSVDGDGFYFGYQRPEAIPVGYSAVSSREVRPFDNLYAINGDAYNWLTFETLEMKTVMFGADGSIAGANIYNSYGDLVAEADIFELYDAYDLGYYGDYYTQEDLDLLQLDPFTFEALGGGTYYIELLGAEGDFEVYIDSTDVYLPAPNIISAGVESTFTHTEDTKIYSVTIDQPTELKGIIDLAITDEFNYSSQYHSYVEFYNDNEGQGVRYSPYSFDASLEVYSEDGLLVYSFDYDFTQLFTDFVDYYSYEIGDYDDIDDAFAKDFFKQEIDIDLLAAGSYTFVYNQDLPVYPVGMEPDIDDTTEIVFSYTSSDSVFELSKGDTLSIPVVFSPAVSGGVDGLVNMSLDNGTTDIVVDLHGNGAAGDLEISENAIQATYPEFIQSGTTTVISSTIYNDGPGITVGNSALKFYLSTDDVLGNDDDIALLLTDGSDQLVLDDFSVYEEIEFLSSVAIPSTVSGDYYLFTELMQSDIISEPDTDISYTQVRVDPYQTVVEVSEVNIELNSSIVPSIDYTTDPDGIGNTLQFGFSGIDNIIPEYVNFFNRSDADVKITDVELAEGLHYYASLSVGGGAAIPENGVIVTPGQYQRIYVYFDPQFFDAENVSLNDVITVTTTETQYKVELEGEVLGGDLVVLENTGVENDDIIVMPATRPGNTSEPITITLTNFGSDVLTVNEFDFLDAQTPFSVIDPDSGSIITDGFTINPGDQVEVNVLFNPTTVGISSGVLVIRSTDPADNFEYSLDISGEGVNPVVRIYEDSATSNDNSIAYGTHGTVKSSEPVEQIILHNIGSDTLYISDISFANDNPDDFTILEDLFGDSDIIEVEPGQEMVFNVQFVADQVGNYSDSLSITSRDDVEVIHFGGSIKETIVSVTYDQTGEVVDDVDLGSVAVNSLVTEFDVERIEIFNFNVNGQSPVYVSTVEISNSGFSLLDNDGNSSQSIAVNRELESGQKISLYVQFDAYYDGQFLADGEHTATVTINGSVPTQYDVFCDVVVPEIDVDNSDVNFDETLIGQKSSRLVNVSNTGTSDLVITGYESSDDQYTLANSDMVIAAGESADIEFVYEPDSIDSSNAVIKLLTSDMDESEVVFNLAGVSAGNTLEPTKVSGDVYQYVFNNSNDQRVKLTVKYVTGLAKGDSEPLVYLDASDDSGNISKIVMPGSLEGSSISVSGAEVEILSIEAGSLNSIKAARADLTGDVYLSGSLKQVQFDQIAAGSTFTVMDDVNDISVKADTIAENTVFDIHADVKTFQASSFASGSLIANNIKSFNVKNGDMGADLISYNEIKSVNVNGDIEGDIRALNSIGNIKAGGDIVDNFIIAGDDSIENAVRGTVEGSIKSVQAGGDISANIMAADNINKIVTAKGSMTGHVRAENIKAVTVGNIDDAVISAAKSLGSVSVKNDISDSFLMGGYDIGIAYNTNDLNTYQDDSFSEGSIGKISFGGQFSDSYVTAGAMPSFALDSLYGFSLSGGENQSVGSSDIGSVKGKFVDTSSDSGTMFGFYASGSIKINLDGDVDFQIVESFE